MRVMRSHSRARQSAVAASASLATMLLLAGCDQATPVADSQAASRSSLASPSAAADPVRLSTNLGSSPKAVPVSTLVQVEAVGGTLESVTLRAGRANVPGRLSADGSGWQTDQRLEPGTKYVLRSVARRTDGQQQRDVQNFRTATLSLDQQTYPSVAPLQGETVGVGMPVIVSFDVPIRHKASFEKHMTVTSTPRQRGSWHWLSDQEAHWRPAHYWRAGTDVSVDVDVNSVPAGGGVFGQESRRVRFHVGDANVYRVNAQTHQMKVLQNGKLLRTIPITTGKPGFTTRSGIKVIIEKYRVKEMNSETIGIAQGQPDSYDIDDVEYAMRLTYSGEFVHAAPWSVGSQGYANVSHGCTGMSTGNAGWLYSFSKRGDVVEYTGTDAYMSLTNGFGDWNLSFADYRLGSALD